MPEHHHLHGKAAPLPIANLDTDQIMPKQFLRGIDKAGLDRGLLYDLRHDATGALRHDFVLNRPAYADSNMLIAGANFGCGSSREHAVWGLLQFGIRAIIAPSYGEIFYSNALNNGLLLVTLPEEQVQRLLDASTQQDASLDVVIDVRNRQLDVPDVLSASFPLSQRHRDMFLQGTDMTGGSLSMLPVIQAFAQSYWAQHPWARDVARLTRDRLSS